LDLLIDPGNTMSVQDSLASAFTYGNVHAPLSDPPQWRRIDFDVTFGVAASVRYDDDDAGAQPLFQGPSQILEAGARPFVTLSLGVSEIAGSATPGWIVDFDDIACNVVD
jgi:hypothetical protein